MALPLLGLHRKSQTNKVPLLMERADNRYENEHVIEVASNSDASSGSSHERASSGLEQQHREDQPSTSSRAPLYPLNGSNSRNSSLIRRGNSRGSQRSPLNSGLWISIELVLTVSQIIAAIIVLSLSNHEKPGAPLRTWIVGYASGCLAILPLLYWRFKYRNQVSEQVSSQQSQEISQGNNSSGSLAGRVMGAEDRWTTATTTRGASNGMPNPRLKVFVEYFKMALDCFFAVWFVVGNVWIFGGHSSSTEAPNLYRLCIVFLIFSCIGYAMPFILCATICCCLPCIFSVLRFREDSSPNRGATQESISSLPTYKFKARKNKSSNNKESSSGEGEGGIVAAGTEKERLISGEDAVCCICLAKYAHNDELRELPCSHFFHKDCVDKWLKINASCPFCKTDVGETILSSLTQATSRLRDQTM
ncbi:E3 ubiquitin-protein ligase At1g63170-like [Primulina huaijiensis]|uniref:E3 ubiquitin-protein ligase At1g63170-like n=1 Tax=Primulina huaijiensis TaxID=1492673 RepID=UPI003CC78406